jgi:uroporphyrinogen III methyltransferase/synthase
MELYGREALEGVRIASIGPVTTKTLRSFGLTVHIEATQSHIPGLVDAMEVHMRAAGSP